jgi:hypothetical protein
MFWSAMAIIRRQATLQRKCFTCITCMCCIVKVKILVFKNVFRSSRIFNRVESCCEAQWWLRSFTVGPLYCVGPVCGAGRMWCCAWCVLVNTSHTGPTQYRATHACNTCEAFPLKWWSLSNNGHHWPKHVESSFYYEETLLHYMKFSPNFNLFYLPSKHNTRGFSSHY